MTDTFSVKITGSNQSHDAFVQLTQDAKTAGQSVEQMSTKSGRSLQDINQRATAVGAAFGTMIGGVALAGRAFQNQEQQIRTLNRAYGESSAEIQRFSRDLQQSTTFSDDAARQSSITAATLIRNYGLTAAEVEKVIKASADLAAVNGVSLADATQRVTAAIRGEAESAEALGLTMNQQAIDREGLTLTMSAQEAAHFRLNALLEQSAFAEGAAGDAAATHAGQAKQLINVLQDQVQAIGQATGVTGEYLSVLSQLALIAPIAGASISTILGGLGGLSTLGPLVAPVASLAFAYDYFANREKAGGGISEQILGTATVMGAGAAQKLTPGSYGDTFFSDIQKRYGGELKQADVEKMFSELFFGVSSVEDVARVVAPILQKGGFGGPAGFDFTTIPAMAKAHYQTPAEYITSQAALAGYVFDPTTQQLMSPLQVSRRTYAANAYQVYDPNVAAAALRPTYIDPYGGKGIYNPFPSRGGTVADYYGPTATTYRAGGMGAVANDVSGMGGAPVVLSAANQDLANAANAAAYSAALRDQYGAYAKLIEGVNAAQGASMAFKATQDGLLDSEKVYGGQISEFTSQIDAMSAAHDILNQRVEEGGTLTKEQQEFQDNYDEALKRGTGGVEDATLAQGKLAEQYLLNMEKGDQINDSVRSQTESTGDLVDIIRELVLSMEGIPPEVRTKLLLEQDQAMSDLLEYQAALGQIPPNIGTTLTVYPNYGSDVLRFIGGGTQLHGGVVGYDNGGVVIHAGEAGPEFMHFANGGSAWASSDSLYSVPRGTYVTPAPASVGKGGRGGITINGNVIVMANDARQMEQSIREYAIGNSRG